MKWIASLAPARAEIEAGVVAKADQQKKQLGSNMGPLSEVPVSLFRAKVPVDYFLDYVYFFVWQLSRLCLFSFVTMV